MRRQLTALCAGSLLALSVQAQESPLTLGAGFHYSSGDYGTSSTTDIASLAATAKYDAGPWTYRATVPYLKIDGDNAVIPGVGNASAAARATAPNPGSATSSSERPMRPTATAGSAWTLPAK